MRHDGDICRRDVRSKDGVSSPFFFAAAQIGGSEIALDTNFHTFRINVPDRHGYRVPHGWQPGQRGE
jgi:hypothetical protein